MIRCLVFSLYAPLTSWGDIAPGETRGSWTVPSRSAVLGILAAALGLDRLDQAAHDALETGYGLAVRLDAAGTSTADYHTAQTARASLVRKTKPTTRKGIVDLGQRALETMLSRRALRQDALASAALWERGETRWSLEDLAEALKCPSFTLYAGRKANVFGLPLRPTLIERPTLAGVFADFPPLPDGLLDREPGLRRVQPAEGFGRDVAFDPLPEGVESGLALRRTETRRDGAPNRERWQFAERTVAVGRLPEAPAP